MPRRSWRRWRRCRRRSEEDDFAEDVAEFYVGGDENNQQTAEEALRSTIATLPDDKLTELAL
jgi:DNA-directed RNA polymerase specialized sigma24 family protein